jgi:elongator complex protein 3
LAILKRRASKRSKNKFLTDAELLSVYHKLVRQKSVKKNSSLENLLRRRAVRTLSGVAPVTVLTQPFPCPGNCLYCPDEPGLPKSYLKNEPAASRAWMSGFNPFKQVKVRLKALRDNGHPTDKIELIVLGGTWSAYPKKYQYWFIKECFRAANAENSKFKNPSPTGKQKKSKIKGKIQNLINSLKQEQRKNEKAKNRIIGLTLETRPDFISLAEIKTMRDLGCTRVELGVQSVYDEILNANRRGHSVAQTAAATKLLKDAGFKINHHIMLNLPGSTPARDLKVFKTLFSDARFQPDLLKIYPCVVLKTAPLYRLWRQGKYRPYSEKQLVNLLIKIKKIIPPYVRIQRIIRDIPKQDIVAGSQTSNLRQLIANSGKKQCHCIRCREIRGRYRANEKIKLFRLDYPASGGQEIFLSYENPDQEKLYALLRLRLPGPEAQTLPVLKNAALIRELHTYGELVPIGQKDKQKTQHAGLGKKLMAEAEKIVKTETDCQKIAVIAGVGIREYYRKLGYSLKEEYMVKEI